MVCQQQPPLNGGVCLVQPQPRNALVHVQSETLFSCCSVCLCLLCVVLCCVVLCCALLFCVQYCRMAADPVSALLLQPTCRAVAGMHNTVLGAILGPLFVLSRERAAACSSIPMSARVLGWYAQAIFGLFIPVAAYGSMEWRLKGRWVKQTLGKQLVYGPLCWPQGHQRRTGNLWLTLHNLVKWLLGTVICWVLLWEGVTWVVPQLPMMPCQTCEQAGTCMAITCGEFGTGTPSGRCSVCCRI